MWKPEDFTISFLHSVEILGFFYHTDFTWNQFWPFQCQFGELQPSKSAKMNKNQIQTSEPLNVLKWQIFRLLIGQKWFHVKSEWQKISVISTQCSWNNVVPKKSQWVDFTKFLPKCDISQFFRPKCFFLLFVFGQYIVGSFTL